MLSFRLTIDRINERLLERMLASAIERGHLRQANRVRALLAVGRGQRVEDVAVVLRVGVETVTEWVRQFLLYGAKSAVIKTSPGRPAKLTKTQKRQLSEVIDAGPKAAGYPGGCWRSPMIQDLIRVRFGVFYSVKYIAQLLANLGFSFQKARFVADRRDEAERRRWLERTWPEILEQAKRTGARILFGDEASFPQWGTLSYTWARRGQQPVVETCGIRKGYKVFGLIDYLTGRLFAKAHEGRFTSVSYQQFLKDVMKQTRKPLIIIQDRACYHTSAAMREFFATYAYRLTAYELPAYSPDFNPIEMLWKKVKQKETHLVYFPTFDALKDRVDTALLRFQNAPHEILSLFGFYPTRTVAA